MKVLVFVIALWFPWRTEYFDSLAKFETVWHEQPCDVGAWTGPDKSIHLCPAPGDPIAWLWLHESQHLLAGHNLPSDTDWKKFRRVALSALENMDLDSAQYQRALDVAPYGGHELHAELPWIVQGDIPKDLQPWYPWFDLD